MDDMPEPDKTVVGLDEMFSLLAYEGIAWQVNQPWMGNGRSARKSVYKWPRIEVGGFEIHLSEGDFTAEKLLAALKEGYDRVMRHREMANDIIKKNKPGSHA